MSKTGEELILKTNNVFVRVISINSFADMPWHYHSEITENIICLEGVICVEVLTPKEESHELTSGQRLAIQADYIHRVRNKLDKESKFLLIQGIGTYDFIEKEVREDKSHLYG